MDQSSAPQKICCLRLSSIGDCISALAVVQLIKKQKPDSQITWIIGKLEHNLMTNIPGINFIPYDKKGGIKEILRLKSVLKNERFDCLLDMQSSLKASIISLLVHSPVKYGFDEKRAMDMQQLFTNNKVPSPESIHVLDGFMAFAKQIGCRYEDPVWDFNLQPNEFKLAEENSINKKTVIISPCSSKDYKNWTAFGYIEICRYMVSKGFKVVICGSKSAKEKAFNQQIVDELHNVSHSIINLTGKTSLREMLAIISRAGLVISPDSSAVHMANALNVPVIGIYAHHNPLRVGPSRFMTYVVSIYDEEIKKEHGHTENLKWRTRVKNKRAMLNITSKKKKKSVDKIICDFHL